MILGFGHGRFEEALDWNAKGLEIDPLNPLLAMDRGFLLAGMDRFQEVIDLLQPYVDAGRATLLANFILALSYRRLGRREGAQRETARVIDAAKGVPNFDVLAAIAELTGTGLDEAEARERFRECIALRDEGYVQALSVAWAAAAAGALDEAFEWLDRAYEERDGVMFLLKYHPASAPLRGDPRFDAFLERVGFPNDGTTSPPANEDER